MKGKCTFPEALTDYYLQAVIRKPQDVITIVRVGLQTFTDFVTPFRKFYLINYCSTSLIPRHGILQNEKETVKGLIYRRQESTMLIADSHYNETFSNAFCLKNLTS
jgi:hypothetical protein